MPRNNKFFSFWLRFSPFVRRLLTAIALALVITTWYFFVYRAREERVATYRAHISTPQQQRASIKKEKEKQKHLQEDMHQTQHILKTVACDDSELADQFTMSMASIIQQARASGVTFNSCTFCDECDKDWCAQQSTTCSFSGNLYQLLHFFDALRSSKDLVQCTKLNLNRSAEKQFTANCTLQFYAIKNPST